jgi:tetratricopeptide (TPR) repeat protein
MKSWVKIVVLLLGVVGYAQGLFAAKPKASQQVADPVTEQQFTYYLYAAQRAMDASDYDDALALSEFAYRLKPTDPTINYFLGILYRGLRQDERSLAHFKTAYEQSPTDYWQTYFATLYAHGEAGNQRLAKQAKKVIETEYKRQPDKAEVLEAYQQMLVTEGQFAKALKVQDRIDRQEGKTPYNVLKRYRILLVEGKGKEAVQVVENYCKEEPDDDYFQAFRGDMYLALGQKEKAQQLYNQAYSDNPDNPYLLQSLARFYKSEHAYQEEREMLDALLSMAPDEQLLDLYFESLSQDTTVGNDEQVAFVQKAYLMEPNSAKWHYYWALALAQQDSIQPALEVLEEGIRLGGKEAVIRFSMHVLSGDLYLRLEQLDSCFNHYEKALLLDPENVYVLNNYAYTLAVNGGDLKKAEKMSQKTIEKEPNNATYLDTYAWILHLQGQDSLAKFYMRRAMEKAGEMSDDQELKQHYNILFEQDENKEK